MVVSKPPWLFRFATRKPLKTEKNGLSVATEPIIKSNDDDTTEPST